MREWINYVKQKIERGKQDASVWYGVASRWFMMGNILLYVGSCIVAGGMVGPVRYIEILYHCCHFEQAAPRPAVKLEGCVVPAPNADGPPIRTKPLRPLRPPKLNPESSF